MNIYVDGTPLLKKPDGVGRYATSLLSELVGRDDTDIYRVIAFWDDKRRTHTIPAGPRLKYEYLPVPRQAYNQWFKRIGAVPVNKWLKHEPDIVFYPNFVAFPKLKNAKSVLVIHDLAYIEKPETLAKRRLGPLEKIAPYSLIRPNLWYLEKFVAKSLKEADAVVAVSEETRDAIAQRHGINASDITVVPNAVDNRFFKRNSIEAQAEIKKHYELPEDFILFLGTIEPRKNVLNLLEAYALLPKKIRGAHPLVIAGKPGWNSKPIYKKIGELIEAGEDITTIGFVDDADLPALYQLASLFAWPSLHEGFGLPILEAMASGTPVVTSDLAPMNRIGEDAALFIDPESPGDIAKTMASVLGSSAKAKTMAKRGREVAKKHTWSGSADSLRELIKKLGND